MENFNGSIELNGSQLMGLYKEFNKLGLNLGHDYPCMRELFREIEDKVLSDERLVIMLEEITKIQFTVNND